MAAGDTMSFIINDSSTGGNNPQVKVTITENANGTLTFNLTQLVFAGAFIGDLRGFFFDLPNAQEGALAGATALSQIQNPDGGGGGTGTATQSSTAVVGNDNVMSAGSNSNNLNGLTSGGDGYDFGLEIGSEGVGANGNDVRSFQFTLDSNKNLALADFANATFGVRIMSVGQDTNGDGSIDTARNGSSKISETTFNPDFVAVDDHAVCVDEGATGSVGNVLTNDDDATKTDLDLVKVSYNGIDHFFDSNDATNDFVTIALASGASVKIWQNGDYQVDATGADVAVETFDDVTYTVQKTFFETNGSVAGTSTESAKLTVEVCPVDDGGGENPPPPPEQPPPSIAKSPGFWDTHDGAPNANQWDLSVETSFESYFSVSGPYAGNWDVTPPVNGAGATVADITFQDAVGLPNGGGGQNLLAKEATTAALNLAEDDLSGISDSFVAWYIYERATFASADADAADNLTGFTKSQILDDLKQQVQDAFTGAADAYTVGELAQLLKLTHEV